MPAYGLYILLPANIPPNEVSAIEAQFTELAFWNDYRVRVMVARSDGRIEVPVLRTWLYQRPGPVVASRAVHKSVQKHLNERLGHGIVVEFCLGVDPAHLLCAAEQARERFERGEPLLPADLGIAALIVRKLRNDGMWGGKKSYQSEEELANGRGLHPSERGAVLRLAAALVKVGLLKTKRGDGNTKYALNKDHTEDIHRLADSLIVPSNCEHLMSGPRTFPSNRLHSLSSVNHVFITPDGGERVKFPSLSTARSHAETLPEGCYDVELTFDRCQEQMVHGLDRTALATFLTNAM